jgi:hypothetical protein
VAAARATHLSRATEGDVPRRQQLNLICWFYGIFTSCTQRRVSMCSMGIGPDTCMPWKTLSRRIRRATFSNDCARHGKEAMSRMVATMPSGASVRCRMDLPMPWLMVGCSSQTRTFLRGGPTRLIRRGPMNVPDTKTFYGDDERGYIDYPKWANSGT